MLTNIIDLDNIILVQTFQIATNMETTSVHGASAHLFTSRAWLAATFNEVPSFFFFKLTRYPEYSDELLTTS